ncbi:MAG: Nif3-like dinuclear metal center hexameric protein [Desulfobulbaceae bacterium A2]|nr:MAG: Nif3-like dinuclear metal center hexameric protein [Desulfobulbaceae bacterium A2]
MRLRTDVLLEVLEGIAPAFLAEPWDNIGLLVGHPAEEVRGILIGLDPTAELLAQAQTLHCNTVITHHPAIFHPLKRLVYDLPQATLLRQATLAGLQLIACHSNLDNVCGGLNDLLAESLGLERCRPLQPLTADGAEGAGRIGELAQPLAPEEFLALVEATLTPPWLLAAGRPPQTIRRVALCGGSGSFLAEAAWRLGAEVYLTAEVKHADARWAEAAGLWLLDAGHFATEVPVIAALARRLQESLPPAGADIPIHIAREQPPLRLLSSGTSRRPSHISGEHA